MNPSAINELLDRYFEPIAALREIGPSNIFINGADVIFYEKSGKKTQWAEPAWSNDMELTNSIKLLANSLAQPIKSAHPLLDARLRDGSRVNAVLPPISQHPCISLRLFPKRQLRHTDLVASGSIEEAQMAYLINAVREQKNMLVSGCTDAGKTTLLKALCPFIPPERRLLILEDTAELDLPLEEHPNMISLESARRSEVKIEMASLVVNSLRMAPDALVLGELRDSKTANALRTVLNTGVRGIMSTLHANSAQETLTRVHDLIAEENPNISYKILAKNINANIDVVVNMTKTDSRGRHVHEILSREGDTWKNAKLDSFAQKAKTHRKPRKPI